MTFVQQKTRVKVALGMTTAIPKSAEWLDVSMHGELPAAGLSAAPQAMSRCHQAIVQRRR